ncbi:MAG: DUF58 domain-containing protein [Halieaceae bacterium]|nr:DUF58 domain-containing protein [Halieaceae bacterium]
MASAPYKAPALGAYCELAELIEQRHPAGKLDLNQRKRALSLLSGPNKTNFRGRGIDFEEVRAYQPGDDIRTIDWRVTARTGTAYTKLFREERERQVLVCVDQRSNMFFGSRTCCKSVLAARLGALLSWAALQRGDRLGGLVFSEREHHEIRPRRSRRSVLGLLNALTAMNQALPLPPTENPQSFADMLAELRRIARPGSSLFLVSDFRGALETSALEQLYQLGRHLEITALHCSDPLEQTLPDAGRYAVTDGESRVQLFTGEARLRDSFADRFQAQLAELRQSLGKLGIPMIEASTAESPLGILQAYYAGGGSR